MTATTAAANSALKLARSAARELPRSRWCFAYGSGAIPQAEAAPVDKGRLLDLIFVADNTTDWHTQNLKTHADHYSWPARILGASTIARVGADFGAHTWFNTLVDLSLENGSVPVKYGVISTDDLLKDLTTWSSLYVSGRLHKPVLSVNGLAVDDPLSVAQQTNLRSAMACALLQMPPKFTEEELYVTIASLSYAGDIRMAFAEDPRKVEKIVRGNFAGFQSLYSPLISEAECLGLKLIDQKQQQQQPEEEEDAIPNNEDDSSSDSGSSSGSGSAADNDNNAKLLSVSNPAVPSDGVDRQFEQDFLEDHRVEMFDRLPITMQELLYTNGATMPPNSHHVKTALAKIVRRSSTRQTAMGLVTAGIGKSALYAFRKVRKKFGV